MVALAAQQRQGLHGEGFVFALASAAGLVAAKPVLDVDGIGWEIGHPGAGGRSEAVRAHREMLPVTTRGNLTRRGTRLHLAQATGFRLLPGSEADWVAGLSSSWRMRRDQRRVRTVRG